MAQIIIEESGSNSQIKFLPPLKEGDMKKRKPDIGKMRKLLGRELLPLREGVRHLLNNGLLLYK